MTALVAGQAALRSGADGKKFAQRTLVLLSNVGGRVASDEAARQVAAALRADGVELTAM